VSGPALRQVSSHRAIHEHARQEVEEVLAVAERLLGRGDSERFIEVAEVFLEVAETRVLVHAHEEEIGLYLEWVESHADVVPFIDSLKEEHEELRRRAVEVEEAMIEGRHQMALQLMMSFLKILKSHADHEESVLIELNDKAGSVSS
jgi:hemerythrin